MPTGRPNSTKKCSRKQIKKILLSRIKMDTFYLTKINQRNKKRSQLWSLFKWLKNALMFLLSQKASLGKLTQSCQRSCWQPTVWVSIVDLSPWSYLNLTYQVFRNSHPWKSAGLVASKRYVQVRWKRMLSRLSRKQTTKIHIWTYTIRSKTLINSIQFWNKVR